jgi:hypothetical protein
MSCRCSGKMTLDYRMRSTRNALWAASIMALCAERAEPSLNPAAP